MALNAILITFILAFHTWLGRGQDQSTPATISCDEELTASSSQQILRSPNSPYFPYNYPNNLHCVIHIYGMEGTAIELQFLRFELEDDDDCAKDTLVVYDGIDEGQRLLQHSCGPNFAWPHFPDTVRSTSNVVTLVFITDESNTFGGYLIVFKAVKPEPSIFVLAAKDENRLHVIRRHSALNFGLVPEGIQSPQAVDYDPVEGYVYYSDVVTKIIGRIPIYGGETEILHRKEISNPFALRIDVVNRLLYWTDADMASISVSNLEGSQRQTLISSGLHKPGAIVQDPNRGYIYFTDWGFRAKIEAAEGDGTGRRTVVDTQISSPQGLTIDLTSSVLYWVDTLLDTLERVDVTGSNRLLLAHFNERDPFALVLDDGGFFFTDEEFGWIEMIGREPINTNGFRVHIGSIREPRGLTLRPLYDNGSTENYTCPRADCSHLCLPKPNQTFVCSQVLPILFNCPSDITQMVPNTLVTWTEPVAASPKGLTVSTTRSNTPGEEFSVGIHPVSYKFEDTLCNRVYCNFTISITVPHMIICPEDIYKHVAKGQTEVIVTWVPPKDTEGRLATSSSHNPGDSFTLGETIVTYSANYDGILEECSFSIFVEEVNTTGPMFLSCPSIITGWVKPGETAKWISWSFIELENEAHVIDENQWNKTGGIFYEGVVEIVHLRARDGFGNVADCNFTVEVKVDSVIPTIMKCPSDISITVSKSEDTATVDWREPTATDNSGNVSLSLTDGPSPGSILPVGTVTVTYLAEDSVSNEATCTFVIIISVKDEVPPENTGIFGQGSEHNILIIFGSAICALLLLLLCTLLFISYRCRRKPAREIHHTGTLPPDYSYAVSSPNYQRPVSSVSLGVSGGAVQYRVDTPADEPLYDMAAVGLPPAYESEKKVDLSEEKGIPPGYQ